LRRWSQTGTPFDCNEDSMNSTINKFDHEDFRDHKRTHHSRSIRLTVRCLHEQTIAMMFARVNDRMIASKETRAITAIDRCYRSPRCLRKWMIAKITNEETRMIAADRWYRLQWCSRERTITTIDGDENRQRENKKWTTINLAGDCCHVFLVVVKCKDTCTHNTRKALSILDWLNN
jgi:hypothetical protein